MKSIEVDLGRPAKWGMMYSQYEIKTLMGVGLKSILKGRSIRLN